MLLVPVDRESETPLYKQIVNHIITMVEDGRLLAGNHLPSARQLASDLGMTRSTVTTSYEQLWSLGYVDITPGGHTTVRKPRPLAATQQDKSVMNWEQRAPRTLQALGGPAGEGIIDMARFSIDPRLMPIEDFRRSFNNAILVNGAHIFEYSPTAGVPGFREAVTRLLARHGIQTPESSIVVTNGGQQGIDLITRFLAGINEGERPLRAVVEDPTYATLLGNLKANGYEALPAPMKSNGVDLDVVERLLRDDHPTFVFSMPNFHNPTGISTIQEHREKLLALCETYRTPLVEDGFEEELKYTPRVTLPIKSMDRHGVVFYLGTFSKVLLPGVRMGWIVAPEPCIAGLSTLKYVTDLSASLPMQAALVEFLNSGAFDRHVARLHRIFRKRMRLTLELLETHLSHLGVTWSRPDGGFLVWLDLGERAETEDEILALLHRHGVSLTTGARYFVTPTPARHFRLSIGTCNEEEIESGIRRIRKALESLGPARYT